MRAGTKLFLFTSLAFASGVALTIGFERAYAADGFLKNSLDAALQPPITPTKIMIVASALAAFVALPIAIGEWRSETRFVRFERDLRAARPIDEVSRYEGPEGRGFLFDGPEGRILLLEPTGGIGDPRVLELPALPLAIDDGPGEGEGDAESGGGPGPANAAAPAP